MSAVYPPGRFGALDLQGNLVSTFKEKPKGDGGINGGFFVLSPDVLNLIEDDLTIWEQGPLETLATNRQIAAYEHKGFWQPMDTLRVRFPRFFVFQEVGFMLPVSLSVEQ